VGLNELIIAREFMNTDSVNQFTFWFSVVAALLDVLLLTWGVWQAASSQKDKEVQLKEKELHKSQVKIWQHFANGINHNLLMIWQAASSKKLDKLKPVEFGEIIKGIQSSTHALYTSLMEERLFTDEEIKQRQLETEESFKTLLKEPASSESASKRSSEIKKSPA